MNLRIERPGNVVYLLITEQRSKMGRGWRREKKSAEKMGGRRRRSDGKYQSCLRGATRADDME